MAHLTSSFLEEVFKLCFVRRSFLEIVKAHLLYSYIPKELQGMKFILQSIVAQFDISGGKLPSYGIISQQYETNPDVQNALQKIKAADIIDQELAVKQLFEFIRDIKFQVVFENAVQKYNEDKKEEAFKIFVDGAEELTNFSLKSETSQFLKVFANFKEQLRERQIAKETGESKHVKVPFGIDILDIITDGGMDIGDTALWIMPSGRGKSTALKHTGLYACRLGYNVLHIQLEGSRKECYDKYSQIWTACTYSDIKWGNIDSARMIKIDRVIEDMAAKNRDVEVFAFERYGSASIAEVRGLVIEYNKIHGKFPDLILIDSHDLLITGENKKIDFDPAYKKDKLQIVAQREKDLAVEFGTRILTATQTGDIPKEKWNNENWVITRENTEGDRTLVKPFAHVFTGNTTVDEKKKNLTRIHIEKLRYYDVKDETYPIFTAYNVGKYYDKQRTLRDFAYMYENK